MRSQLVLGNSVLWFHFRNTRLLHHMMCRSPSHRSGCTSTAFCMWCTYVHRRHYILSRDGSWPLYRLRLVRGTYRRRCSYDVLSHRETIRPLSSMWATIPGPVWSMHRCILECTGSCPEGIPHPRDRGRDPFWRCSGGAMFSE